MLKLAAMFAAVMFVSAAASAADRSFVGVWADPGGGETYTKLVVHDAGNVTYCYVQSCRQMECSDWRIDGSTENTFSHRSELGDWQFARVSQDAIDGRFTTATGGVSTVTYSPE